MTTGEVLIPRPVPDLMIPTVCDNLPVSAFRSPNCVYSSPHQRWATWSVGGGLGVFYFATTGIMEIPDGVDQQGPLVKQK